MGKLKISILIVLSCVACMMAGLAIGIAFMQPEPVETVAVADEPTPEPTEEPVKETYFVIQSATPAEEPTVEREPVRYMYEAGDSLAYAYSRKEIYHVGEKIKDIVTFTGAMDGRTRVFISRSTVGQIVSEIYNQYCKVATGYGGVLKLSGDGLYTDDADEFTFDIYEDNNVYVMYWFTVVIQADPFSFVIYDAKNNQTAYGDSNFYVDGITIEE